ncbi:hypothetical protein PRIPAC_82935 [Pristionchus pacificus]|nr:hypothetical protein PRIPAC_82935 [Pristionchus pacificus]|eukprot:PDM70496.1 hypothetical protein PRIPAC_46742 [Pristionchus pacificus]
MGHARVHRRPHGQQLIRRGEGRLRRGTTTTNIARCQYRGGTRIAARSSVLIAAARALSAASTIQLQHTQYRSHRPVASKSIFPTVSPHYAITTVLTPTLAYCGDKHGGASSSESSVLHAAPAAAAAAAPTAADDGPAWNDCYWKEGDPTPPTF